MKLNTLEKLLVSLEAIGTEDEFHYRVKLSDDIIQKARIPVMKMLAYN